MSDIIYALSVRPPWSYFIIYGIPLFKKVDTGRGDGSYMVELSGKVVVKDVENRAWSLPETFELPQRIYIHSGKRDDAIEIVLDMCLRNIGFNPMVILSYFSKNLPRGAIIGTVEIIECTFNSQSPWAIPGQHHIVLRDPEAFSEPVPCRGKLGLFKPDIEVK